MHKLALIVFRVKIVFRSCTKYKNFVSQFIECVYESFLGKCELIVNITER